MKKKVAIFLDYYYIGGIEKIIENIYDNLKNKYNIDIISFVSKNKNVKSLLNKEYTSFSIRNILGLNKLRKYFKNNKYDIVHINCYNSFGLIYAFMIRKYVKKIIIHAHNSNVDFDFLNIKKIINFLIKKIFNSNKYEFIAVSDEACKFCFNTNKYEIILNAIDYNKFYFNNKKRIEYRNKYNISEEKIVIGHIGRFVPQKNHNFLIDIFNELCKISDDYILILVGEGKLYNKIMKKINNFNLNNKVIYFKYRDDINDFINMFDIYLFPSIYEGFPITLIETQINGRIIFTSDNITSMLKISNRIKFLSLKKGANYWARKINKYQKQDLVLDYKLNLENFISNIDNIYSR